jgi:hypothetical protein
MVAAPDGENFNPKYTDKTDSYVALGAATDVKNFILKNNPEYDADFAGWTGGGDNPEKSSNSAGKKTKAIGIDANGAASAAKKDYNSTPEEFSGFLTLHGAGHNANLNHSNENTREEGQNCATAAIMGSGNWVYSKFQGREPEQTNIKELMTNDPKYYYNNSIYVSVLKRYFGNKKAEDNYVENKKKATE